MRYVKRESVGEEDIKIHLICQNIFLSLSFSFYLKGHLSSLEEADIVITDKDNLDLDKPICLVGKDLIIPCSVYDIFSQLNDFYSKIRGFKNTRTIDIDLKEIKNEDKSKEAQAIEKINEILKNQNIDDSLRDVLDSLSLNLKDVLNKKYL